MLKLIKYEFRKSMFSKFVMLIALGIAQLIFLAGVTFTKVDKSPVTAIGVVLLVIVTVIGISFIGIESLLTLHKDMNTKQSYMLFMTPHNSYEILGAKILENALAIALSTLFFMMLAGIDLGILLTKLGGYRMILSMIQEMMEIEIDWNAVLRAVTVIFAEGVISWFSMILTGYLAITLSTSVLAGKKISGLVAFILYLILVFAQERIIFAIMNKVHLSLSDYGTIALYGGITAVFALVFYLLSCIMIDKKLSV